MSNFQMWYSSRSFLYCRLLVFTFSNMRTSMFDRKWPGKLKCFPVGFSIFGSLYTQYVHIFYYVSFCRFHQYIVVYKFVSCIQSCIQCFFVWFAVHVSIYVPVLLNFTYGQIRHCLLHLFIPLRVLFECGPCFGGNLVLIRNIFLPSECN